MSRQKLTISQIKDLEAQLSSRYTKAEVDAIISGVEANFNGDLSQLNTLVVAEVSALKTRMLNAEGRLDGLDNDVASLVSADSTESAARIAGDATNAAAISAEETRATTAEAALQASITALDGQFSVAVGELEAKDAEIEGNLATETAARIAGDSALDTRVSALEATDGAYDTRLDTLESGLATEVTDRTSADTQLQGQITSLQSGLANTNSDLNNEIANRVAGDTNLQNQIDALELASGGSITALEGRVTTAEGEIDTLQSDLATEVANRISGDQALDSEINSVAVDLATEVTRAKGVEGDLNTLAITDNNGSPYVVTNLAGAVQAVHDTAKAAYDELDASIGSVATDVEQNYMKKSGIVQQSFVATAGQTVFSLAEPVASVFIAMVMVNGVQQLAGSDFTLSGSTLTFVEGLEANDEVQATYFNK